jgi:hypothetical protein
MKGVASNCHFSFHPICMMVSGNTHEIRIADQIDPSALRQRQQKDAVAPVARFSQVKNREERGP